MPSHSFPLTFILILFSHLGLGLSSLPLSFKFPLQNPVCVYLFPIPVICPAVSLCLVTYLVRTKIIKLLYVTSSRLLLLPRLRPKFIPRHPVLQNRRPMFLLLVKAQVSRPHKTTTTTTTYIYIYIYIYVYIRLVFGRRF